jgi:hypothetical protein
LYQIIHGRDESIRFGIQPATNFSEHDKPVGCWEKLLNGRRTVIRNKTWSQDDPTITEGLLISLPLFSLLSTNLLDNSSIWNYDHPSDWTSLLNISWWKNLEIDRNVGIEARRPTVTSANGKDRS